MNDLELALDKIATYRGMLARSVCMSMPLTNQQRNWLLIAEIWEGVLDRILENESARGTKGMLL